MTDHSRHRYYDDYRILLATMKKLEDGELVLKFMENRYSKRMEFLKNEITLAEANKKYREIAAKRTEMEQVAQSALDEALGVCQLIGRTDLPSMVVSYIPSKKDIEAFTLPV